MVVVPGADGPVLHLSGDVDAALIGGLGGALSGGLGAGAIEDQGIVAVDVRELGYIDSSGLTLLVRWAQSRTRDGADAVIRGTTDRFTRVLHVSGLTDLFVTGP